MRYAAALEYLGHSVRRAAVLPGTTAGREPDIATRVLVEKPRITQISHIVDRVIEVEVVVVHPVHRIAHIVRSMAKLKRHQMNAQAVTLLFPALV